MSFLVIIRGPLGIGKSVVSRRISEIFRAEYISIDDLLDEHGLWNTGELAEFLAANRFAIEVAGTALRKRRPVIVDGNFYWEAQIQDLLAHLKVPSFVFTLAAPLEVCIQRDAGRRSPHGAESARAVYAKATEFAYGSVVDASGTVEEVVQDLLSRLGREGHPPLSDPSR